MRYDGLFRTVALIGGTCLLLTAAPPASADNIVLTGGVVSVNGQLDYTVNGPVGYYEAERQSTGLQPGASLTVGANGFDRNGFSSIATYNFTQSHLRIDFDQAIERSNTQVNEARTYDYVGFTVAADTSYELAGQIAGNAANGNVEIFASLYDWTDFGFLVDATNHFGNSQTEQLISLGSNDGFMPSLLGQLSGTLRAGHTYTFTGFASLDSGSAAASGFVELSFGEPLVNDSAATPLPSTAWSGAVLLGGTSLLMRRRMGTAV